jgi:hypothetical protein
MDLIKLRRLQVASWVVLHFFLAAMLALAGNASTKIDLDGSWRFRTDRDEVGEAQGWNANLPAETEWCGFLIGGTSESMKIMKAGRGISGHLRSIRKFQLNMWNCISPRSEGDRAGQSIEEMTQTPH